MTAGGRSHRFGRSVDSDSAFESCGLALWPSPMGRAPPRAEATVPPIASEYSKAFDVFDFQRFHGRCVRFCATVAQDCAASYCGKPRGLTSPCFPDGL